MYPRLTRLLAVVLVILLLLPAALAGESGEPEPYDPDEFPSWAQSLWRFHVVAIGALPLSYFLTNIGVQARVAIREPGRGFSMTGELEEQSDRRLLLGVTVAVSAGVGILDAILGLFTDDESH